ncbi:MAG TPA: FAD:protein FMN transferase [Hyphomicrobiales bacterium]|nr:FAD:protein FMN transferase [Hyphomicrobiales bacterium]
MSSKALIGLAMGALLLLAGWGVWRSMAVAPLRHLDGHTMGTSWSLQYWSEAPEDPTLALVLGAALTRLDRQIFSTYAPDSELNRLNAAPMGSTVVVSAELHTVLAMAQTVYRQSGGAFDATVGPLVRLWGFGPDPAGDHLPDDEAIAAARARLGMEKLVLGTGRQVRRAAPVELDLSAIAKGYAVDVLADMLEQRGIANYLLEIGGELRVAGTRPDRRPWRIAIEAPLDGPPSAFAVLDNGALPLALAGSGGYRNYREIVGRRYSHELDPRTGWPVDNALAAVTVVSEQAALADAWATALMVLGPDEGLRLADSLNLAAYFIIPANQGFAAQSSQQFKERFPTLGTP